MKRGLAPLNWLTHLYDLDFCNWNVRKNDSAHVSGDNSQKFKFSPETGFVNNKRRKSCLGKISPVHACAAASLRPVPYEAGSLQGFGIKHPTCCNVGWEMMIARNTSTPPKPIFSGPIQLYYQRTWWTKACIQSVQNWTTWSTCFWLTFKRGLLEVLSLRYNTWQWKAVFHTHGSMHSLIKWLNPFVES